MREQADAFEIFDRGLHSSLIDPARLRSPVVTWSLETVSIFQSGGGVSP